MLMHRQIISQQRHNERGQTILFVALALVSLLGMAALAIDVVTLYVARSEIQRAADATALAAAKAVADSGFTTLSTADPNFANAQSLAQNMAAAAISTMTGPNAPNLVGGKPPGVSGSPLVDLNHQGDARITVTLSQNNLPTFFSKIWGRTGAGVVATAAAEAYNPSNNGNFTQIAPLSLKPWLVANTDPIQGTPFINVATGAVESTNTVVGENFNLTSDCKPGPNCTSLYDSIPGQRTPTQVDYVPLQVVANSKNVCPSTCLGPTTYENSIECADVNNYVAPSCGGGAPNATWDNTVNPSGLAGLSASGAECLIHATSTGSAGQDTLDASAWPTTGPMKIKAQSGPLSGQFVTTSSSIVTIPIFDNTPPFNPGPVTVIGYMQAFITEVEGGVGTPGTLPGDINVTVLNISGCSTTPNVVAPPVIGGAGTSPVPVRLITPP
jgi:Flp pilus assembly protein TadG